MAKTDTITIINYGCGNIGAIPNMLKKCGTQARIITTPDQLVDAQKIILPGVGAFGRAMQNLNDRGFIYALNHKILQDKIPILGICLGMQLLANDSEESPEATGFGWIPGHVRRFSFTDPSLKIPHMGWNPVRKTNPDSRLLSELDEARFYHVHSFHYVLDNPTHAAGTTYYGYDFPSIVQHDNIYGVQFHPEKSHRYGLQLLKNFAEL